MHPIQCECGKVSGHIKGNATSNRVVCYCSDCQAFAYFLEKQDEVLDGQGGTEILQVAQSRLHFDKGTKHLAAMRLSPRGVVRWYAKCCKTPIGNTLAEPKKAFIGLIHPFLNRSQLDADFGKKVAVVNVKSVQTDPKPRQSGLFRTIAKFMWIMYASRLSGNYKKSPLFSASGEMVVQPKIMTLEERNALKDQVSSGKR